MRDFQEVIPLESVKVLHMADMHLEWPFAGMGLDGRQGRLRREELKQVFGDIIGLAAREAVQVLLIAGDLFEHAHATRGTMQFIDEQCRRIPGTRVFISPGNHDPYLHDSYYRSYPWAPNVHVFRPEPERVDLPDMPVSVYGWGFGAYEVRSFQLGSLRSADPSRINLAVFHGGDEAYHPFQPGDLAAMGMDYIALGHIHKEGVMLEREGRVLARYSGSPEALSFGEPGEHGVYLGAVGRGISRMAFTPTGRRRYITADVDVAGAVSPEDLVRAVLDAASPADRLQHCYRLSLTGAVDPTLTVDLAVLQEQLAGSFYFLKLTDRTRPDHDLEALARERSARGLFVQRLLEQEEAAADETARLRIRRALALGLAAFDGKGAAK